VKRYPISRSNSTHDLPTLIYEVKTLRKLTNKESQPALRAHYERQLTAAQTALTRAKRNGSAVLPSRAMWKKLPEIRYETA